MKATIKLIVFLGLILGAGVISFDYVEGHEATRLERQVETLQQAVDGQMEITERYKRDAIALDGRLRQVCTLLTAADIQNNLCEFPEKDSDDAEQSNEEGENSDG